jgi:transketolase
MNEPPWPVAVAPFSAALVDLGRARPEVVVLTADLMHWTDTAEFARVFPDRFFNLGMAEQNLVGVGAGLARSDLYPVIVTYGVFATRRAYDQVAMGLGTGSVRALLVGFLPGISSQFKATHQAIDDVALMRALPGMTVVDPCDSTELVAFTLAAPDLAGPCYLRASRGQVPTLFPVQQTPAGPGRDKRLSQRGDFGPRSAGDSDWYPSTRILREGGDAAFVASGMATRWALEAAQVLGAQGISVDVLHMPILKPFDPEAIRRLAARHEVLHVVENHSVIGGLTSAVSEAVAALGLGVRVVAHGLQDRWGEYGKVDYNRRMLGLDAASLSGAVIASLRDQKGRQ